MQGAGVGNRWEAIYLLLTIDRGQLDLGAAENPAAEARSGRVRVAFAELNPGVRAVEQQSWNKTRPAAARETTVDSRVGLLQAASGWIFQSFS
jgi:hypothetical protein